MAEPFKPLKCNTSNCEIEAEFVCYCKSPEIYLCTNHLHNESNHISVGIYKPISEYDRKKIIDLCRKCKVDCLNLKTSLLKECQTYVAKITKSANDLSNNIRQLENLYDELIFSVCQMHKVRFIGDITLTERIISSQVGCTNIDSPYWEVPKIKLDLSLTMTEKQVDLLQYIKDLQPTSLLTFFKKSTKFAVNVNVRNDCKIDIYYVEECPENLGDYSSFCYLPDGTLFSNGGDNGSVQNYTYILNTTTKKFWKKANSSNQKFNSGTGCFFNDFVYVFAGYNSGRTYFTNSEKYNIKNNSWTNISSYPTTVSFCNPILYENSIIISGVNTSTVYQYNIQNNNYGSFYSIPSSSTNKFMVGIFDKLYLFDNNRLIEYKNKNWEIINSSTSVYAGVQYCCPIKVGEFIYFMLNDMYIYRFNFITKKIDKLKSISV